MNGGGRDVNDRGVEQRHELTGEDDRQDGARARRTAPGPAGRADGGEGVGHAIDRAAISVPVPGAQLSWYQHYLATAGRHRQDGRMGTATTASGQHRRAELAAFLRSRRERISPEQAGLAPGTRRRTPGLRREEVAQLAGVGVTWYTWLEQGRQINASTQVLSAVARTLRLDPAEQEHLYRLADVPEAAAAGDAAQVAQVAPDIQEILDGLTTLPAAILNERFDLLAWNHAYAMLFPRIVSQPACERNTLWFTFTYASCCHPYLNRDEQL